MADILDPEIYEKAKKIADDTYKKPSAYKSGFIVKKYKEMGGRYGDVKGEEKKLKRWFNEKWEDIGGLNYPVYRPSIIVNSKTPLTKNEIDISDLQKKIKEKQIIKGDFNLDKFKEKEQQKYKLDNFIFVAPSKKRLKKYDVYDIKNNYITSFGAIKETGEPYEQFKDIIGYYSDYNHNDKKRKDLYYKRHGDKNKAERLSPKWFSHNYLW